MTGGCSPGSSDGCAAIAHHHVTAIPMRVIILEDARPAPQSGLSPMDAKSAETWGHALGRELALDARYVRVEVSYPGAGEWLRAATILGSMLGAGRLRVILCTNSNVRRLGPMNRFGSFRPKTATSSGSGGQMMRDAVFARPFIYKARYLL